MASIGTTRSTASAGVPASSVPRARDPWFDNAKMALVTLVVIGHSWVLLPSSPLRDHAYDFLYAWHVPAFVLITGYLSRSFSYTPDRLWMLVRTVAVPYVLFECLLGLFRIYVGGEQLADLFRDPHWPMWYLAALFFWRLLTPAFAPLPAAVAVVGAIAISLIAGVYAGDTLDFARVFGLLPFFVVGLHARTSWFDALRRPLAKVLAVPVLGGIWWLAGHTDRWASTEWLYYRSRYGDLDVSDERAFVTRAVVMAVGALGALAFLSLVPRLGGWFSRMGAATLVVYLGHGFVVKGAEYAGYPRWIDSVSGGNAFLALLATSVLALGVALLLAAPPVSRVLQHAVDPFGLAQRRVSEAMALAAARRRADVLAHDLHERIEDADDAGESASTGAGATTLRP